MPDPRVEKEARALVRAGYLVTVVGWDRTAQMSSIENRDQYTIYRISIRANFGSGLANLPNLLRWQWGLWQWLRLHREQYDIVHACDFDTILPALWAQRYWSKTVIYDIFDFYADHLRRTPEWIKGMIRRTDLNAVNRADALILCDEARIEQIRGTNPRRVTYIYNSPEDEGETCFQPSPPGYLHLAYIGLIQVERMLYEVLEVIGRHPEWSLDLAGFGGDEEQIVRIADKLPNVSWHGRVSYQKAIELSRHADVLFALYDPSIQNHRFSSPNKIFEAMMLSKPVVVAEHTNMDRIVNSAGAGIVIPYGDKSALELALGRLAADPELRMHLGMKGRQAYRQSYAWEIMEQRLINLYRELPPQ
jgi:glycosyltransferase involved in cell wall biosynthesis